MINRNTVKILSTGLLLLLMMWAISYALQDESVLKFSRLFLGIVSYSILMIFLLIMGYVIAYVFKLFIMSVFNQKDDHTGNNKD
jgi:hypothetical protein